MTIYLLAVAFTYFDKPPLHDMQFVYSVLVAENDSNAFDKAKERLSEQCKVKETRWFSFDVIPLNTVLAVTDHLVTGWTWPIKDVVFKQAV